MGMRMTGLGHAVGSKVVTNKDLEAMMDTSDEWIVTRTGISERHVCDEGETTASLAADAGREALKNAGDPDVDLTIVATCTPNQLMPTTAAYVQGELGTGGGAMDVNVACSGFVYGLVVADGLLASGAARRILLIGSEAFSPFIDWSDRGTAILFADGAGAVVVEATPPDEPGDLLASDLGNDGSLAELIQIPLGSAKPPTISGVESGGHHLRMQGREVFRHAARIVEETSRRSLAKAGLTSDDIDLFVPHQANERIIAAAAERIGIPPERTLVNLHRHGNTSAATIPLALYEGFEDGRLAIGDRVLICGFGAGMSWASAVIRWSLHR